MNLNNDPELSLSACNDLSITGDSFAMLGENTQAILFYERAINHIEKSNPTIPVVDSYLDHLKSLSIPISKEITFLLQLRDKKVEISNNLGNLFNICGDYNSARKTLLEDAQIDNSIPQVMNNLGVTLNGLGWYKESLLILLHAEWLNPKAFEIQYNLSETYRALGFKKNTIFHLQKVLKLDPENTAADYKLAALIGERKKTAPPNYITKLFNTYAKTYEQHLVDKLKYNVPKHIEKLVSSISDLKKCKTVLDLGCGTGLCVDYKALKGKNLTGIDLSKNMLKEAAKKLIYTELTNCDFLNYLKRGGKEYDLFIAGDVFIYVGCLKSTFELVTANSTIHSNFLFSIETLKLGTYQLNDNGRFSHSKAYILTLAKEFGWVTKEIIKTDLRLENETWVEGLIFNLSKRKIE